MRLFLSSYKFGSHVDKLVELVGSNKRVAIITNAGDYHSDTETEQRFVDHVTEFAKLGMAAERLDLRSYFSKNITCHELEKFGLIWATGGNSFILQRAIIQSGFESALFPLLGDDVLVYGGFSAGACVATPSLRGIERCDDPNVVPEAYKKEIIWDAMDVVPFAIAPHYKSNHPESEAIDNVVAYYEQEGIPYETLTDGQAMLISGDITQKLA